MPNGVSCSVANCSFWGQGNTCNAKQIKIDIDAHSKQGWDTEFASEGLGHEHKDKAVQSAETCCQTFQPKE